MKVGGVALQWQTASPEEIKEKLAAKLGEEMMKILDWRGRLG